MRSEIGRRAFLGLAGITTVGAIATMAWSRTPARKFEIQLSDAQWRQRLGSERFYILREAGTERAFTSPLLNEHRKGTFVCAACSLPLFSSATKFDSGTGWPSFFRALPHATATRGERNLLFGTEILCSRCGGHLGHVFNDGPKPTGLRYCMNGLALKFRPA